MTHPGHSEPGYSNAGYVNPMQAQVTPIQSQITSVKAQVGYPDVWSRSVLCVGRNSQHEPRWKRRSSVPCPTSYPPPALSSLLTSCDLSHSSVFFLTHIHTLYILTRTLIYRITHIHTITHRFSSSLSHKARLTGSPQSGPTVCMCSHGASVITVQPCSQG